MKSKFLLLLSLLLVFSTACQREVIVEELGVEEVVEEIEVELTEQVIEEKTVKEEIVISILDKDIVGFRGQIEIYTDSFRDPIQHNEDALFDKFLLAAKESNLNSQDINQILIELGLQESEEELFVVDVDGDGKEEWMVRLHEINLTEDRLNGSLFLLTDEIVYFDLSREPLLLEVPWLEEHMDFTGDGVSDLLIGIVTNRGASNTSVEFKVFSTHFGELQNIVSYDLVSDVSSSLYTRDSIGANDGVLSYQDYDNDGVLDILTHSGNSGSYGGGIYRPKTEIFSWNGESISFKGVLQEAREIRVHELYDANDLFVEGDFNTEKYKNVIFDDTLSDLDYGDKLSEETYDDARQFAALRLVLIYLIFEKESESQDWVDWLVLNYPGTALSDSALLIMDLWIGGEDDLEDICSEVRNSLGNYDNPTGSLLYLGYANPEIGVEDVCPF